MGEERLARAGDTRTGRVKPRPTEMAGQRYGCGVKALIDGASDCVQFNGGFRFHIELVHVDHMRGCPTTRK